MQQQHIVSDPFGFGVVVVTDTYAPSDFEYATKGDIPAPTLNERLQGFGKALIMGSIPLALAIIGVVGFYVL